MKITNLINGHPLLTFNQIEHWLIYHCPLQETSEELADIGLIMGLGGIEKHPLMVVLDVPGGPLLTVCDKTPWKVYHELAKMVFDDHFSRVYVTKLYQNS